MTNSQHSTNAREFWIELIDYDYGYWEKCLVTNYKECPVFEYEHALHVIEKNAFDKLLEIVKIQKQCLETLKNQVEICGDFMEFSRSTKIPSNKANVDFAKKCGKNADKTLAEIDKILKEMGVKIYETQEGDKQ